MPGRCCTALGRAAWEQEGWTPECQCGMIEAHREEFKLRGDMRVADLPKHQEGKRRSSVRQPR